MPPPTPPTDERLEELLRWADAILTLRDRAVIYELVAEIRRLRKVKGD